jgi:hypothetical protein
MKMHSRWCAQRVNLQLQLHPEWETKPTERVRRDLELLMGGICGFELLHTRMFLAFATQSAVGTLRNKICIQTNVLDGRNSVPIFFTLESYATVDLCTWNNAKKLIEMQIHDESFSSCMPDEWCGVYCAKWIVACRKSRATLTTVHVYIIRLGYLW